MRVYIKQVVLTAMLLLGAAISEGQIRYPYQDYNNIIVSNSLVYTLTDSGALETFDLYNDKLVNTYKPKSKIKFLSQDHFGNLIIADEQNVIKRKNGTGWVTLMVYKDSDLYNIVFNSRNECFLITNKGIIDNSTARIFKPDHTFSHSEWSNGRRDGWGWGRFAYYSPAFLDSKDNLWVVSDHGEWGADLFTFDTKTKKFIDQTWVAAFPSFEFNGSVYAAKHGLFYSFIAKYDKATDKDGADIFKGRVIFNTDSDKTLPVKKSIQERIKPTYIMSCIYNKYDGYIYINSTEGLLRLDPKKHNEKFKDLTVLKASEYPSQIKIIKGGNLVLLPPGKPVKRQ
ncbi:hypothetical protein FFF34_005545 [Inquilinus sp. KBS0705]|nr:hypothetical protein FFF34_005545 [Inquilinus sp. KBS0705]